MAEIRDLRVHASSLNARDLDEIASHTLHSAPCICDGEWVGEGPDAVRQALEREFAVNEEAIVRLAEVDGRPTVLEYDGEGQPKAMLHIVGGAGGRIRELRIEHHGAARAPPLRWPIDEPGA
jgi:hypothetical protein